MVSRGVEKTNQAQRAKHYNEFAAMKVIVFFFVFPGLWFQNVFWICTSIPREMDYIWRACFFLKGLHPPTRFDVWCCVGVFLLNPRQVVLFLLWM